MDQVDARRNLEASTEFEIRDGRVWLRQIRWLGAEAALSVGEDERVGDAGTALCLGMTPTARPPFGRRASLRGDATLS